MVLAVVPLKYYYVGKLTYHIVYPLLNQQCCRIADSHSQGVAAFPATDVATKYPAPSSGPLGYCGSRDTAVDDTGRNQELR